MVRMQWLFIVALTAVVLSEAKFHRKDKYNLKLNGNGKPTNEWTFIDDEGETCGKPGKFSEKEEQMLHQRKKLQRELPFTAYLVKRLRHEYEPICMATILPDADDDSSSILLTLTTCIESGAELTHYKVYTGSRFPIPKNQSSDLYEIEEVAVDKNSPNLKYPNAMVVRVAEPIPITQKQQPICLPKPNEELPENSECILSVIRTSGKQTPYLVDVQSKSNTYCKQMPRETVLIDKKMEICGLDYRDGAFIARGGSLICKNKEGKWTQRERLQNSRESTA
uniref:Peptidase S1 domain-containing protein n=1 Tax=Trichuris muris TaxID=70415 RepID=A0A5S6R2U6_TRIMR